MIAHRHHRLRGRSLVLAGLAAGIVAGLTARAGNAQAGSTAPAAAHADTLQPDTTLVFRVDSTGRLWTGFMLDTRYGPRREMHMSGPVPGTGWLGLRVSFPNHPGWRGRGRPAPGEKAPEKPVVRSVDRGSPVESAGLRPGDVIVAVDGVDARVPYLFTQPRPGRVITFRVSRGGSERDVRVTVSPMPSNAQAEHVMRLHAACLRQAAARAASDAEFHLLQDTCMVTYPVH
ncbi:MAG TPA: PDZ domain-containing protein [Longimicrobium sp.]|jgi:hypothetical protein